MAKQYVEAQFPPDTQSALLRLPTEYLSPEPFNDLLRGFEMDLAFSKLQVGGSISPIKAESDLDLYARRVAGTVAELYLELVFYHYRSSISNEEEQIFLQAGGRMGVALQYVNIARDISVDAKIGRAYLPLTWLDEEGLTLEAVIENPQGTRIEKLRSRLLDRAFEIYEEARGTIEDLPDEVRGAMRVAVESYMEIGRALRQEGYEVKAGRATVPKLKRVRVAWQALNK